MGDSVSALTVCCLKTGRRYGPEYANRLMIGVGKHYGLLHSVHRNDVRLVCVTDDESGINKGLMEVIPTSDPQLPGWWAKLSLFRPEGAFGQIKGRVLFLDLDVIITGPLDDLVNYPSDFVMMRDLQRPWRPASAVMLLEAGSRPWIWNEFKAHSDHDMRNFHGDQDSIRASLEPNTQWGGPHYGEHCDFFPQRWIASYKQQAVNGPPPDCRIVAFHGAPKPHEVTNGWVKEVWI